MVYYSKKDSRLVAFVASAVVIPLLIGLYHLFASHGTPRAGWSWLFVGTTTGAVAQWLTYPLYYEITFFMAEGLCLRSAII